MSIYKSSENSLSSKKTPVPYIFNNTDKSARQFLLKLEEDLLLAQRIYSNLITEEAPPFDAPVSVWIRYVDAVAKKEEDIASLKDKLSLQIRIIQKC